ncbi:hypothetical protein GCM10007894_15330 [Paraferrimonas haliotis]|uniref:HlyD family secretion protein n=1 Tax=Paraferrimonas haliotis TaxID=2013866 RepID=A0AA37WYW4_9GAMM|nr:hypothetical protein GCM10007894_15330 [Paraferrimonas haliotis]
MQTPSNDYSYQTEQATQGDISKSVSATGTLAAVDDVVVGAQLSGQITELAADFNDSVTQGQLLARIDPSTFAAKVAQASAQVEKIEADKGLQAITIQQAQVNLEKAKRDLTQARQLLLDKHISQNEVDDFVSAKQLAELALQQAHAQLSVLKANLASAIATLQQNQIDLARTEIRAPIDGFVINRTIERGQTVASSYNTPELFTLAKDLSAMEIEAHIDESDIGQIALEQRVSYTVDAYPQQTFRGIVSQIRKAPMVTSGVVSYRVIIATDNPQNRLFPGMTANLTISVDNVRDVQRVSNAAVRMGERGAAQHGSTSKSGKRSGSLLAGLKPLNLTEQQQKQLNDNLPPRPQTGSRSVNQQYRQKVSALIDEVLTDQQKKLRNDIRNGKVRMGSLLILKEGKTEALAVQLGISDQTNTSILRPDLTGLAIVNQMRSNG